MNFDFELRTRVRFGAGMVRHLGEEAVKLGVERWLVVIDPSLVSLGVDTKILGILHESGLVGTLFTDVDGEPDDNHVRVGVQRFSENDCGGVVAVGGGSAIDAGKVIALMANNPEPIAQYENADQPRAPRVKLIAVPTTAGTGAEITLAAGIIDRDSRRKLVLVHSENAPDLSIDDPELTYSLPNSITAHTGFDALTHALESFVSNNSNPVSDAMALKAIELIGASLFDAWRDGKNYSARENVMLGQLLAGMAVTNTGVALVHAMGRPLGVYFSIPHGLGNAMLLPLVTSYSLKRRQEKYRTVARLLPGDGTSGDDDIVSKLESLSASMEIPTIPTLDLDLDRFLSLVPQMAEDCLASPSSSNNPRVPSQSDVEGLYKSLLFA